MESVQIKMIRNNVLILAIVIASLAICICVRSVVFTPVSIFLLLLGLVFMSIHWWLLSDFIESLAQAPSFIRIFRGIVLMFPLLLALSVVFISAKLSRASMLPSIIGVVSLPFAITLYGLYSGISGFCVAPLLKGRIHD